MSGSPKFKRKFSGSAKRPTCRSFGLLRYWNKGPHIVEAVRVLDNVLRRMEAHQSKKSAKLRQLQLATRFRQPTPTVEKS